MTKGPPKHTNQTPFISESMTGCLGIRAYSSKSCLESVFIHGNLTVSPPVPTPPGNSRPYFWGYEAHHCPSIIP